LKILAIYPGFNPKLDEVSFALPPLLSKGHSVRVITTRISKLKSEQTCADYENFNGVEVFRPFNNPTELIDSTVAQKNEIFRLIDEFSPDLLFLNSFHTLPLARLIYKHREMPSLLRLETLDPLTLLQRRYYLGFPPLGWIFGRAKLWLATGFVDALMTNDPVDLPCLENLSIRGRKVFFAGHCAQQPNGLSLLSNRDHGEMIYIGSLIRHKNCEKWLDTVPEIFEHTPVERFTIIGRGPYEHVVHKLKTRFGNRICHIPEVPRKEAIERLSGAQFAYTESSSGWGFLCDAWSTRTPVLCPQSTFSIVHEVSGLLPVDTNAMLHQIRQLYDDPNYYRALQDGGAQRYETTHTASVVSAQYMDAFRAILSQCSGSTS
jgi:glycosyltransferase involved in cell wall biosynthesis